MSEEPLKALREISRHLCQQCSHEMPKCRHCRIAYYERSRPTLLRCDYIGCNVRYCSQPWCISFESVMDQGMLIQVGSKLYCPDHTFKCAKCNTNTNNHVCNGCKIVYCATCLADCSKCYGSSFCVDCFPKHTEDHALESAKKEALAIQSWQHEAEKLGYTITVSKKRKNDGDE